MRRPTTLTSRLILPKDIQLLSILENKIVIRGRQPGKSKIITSTLNKRELEQPIAKTP